MSLEDITRVLTLLEKAGYESSSAEFAKTLEKFKFNPEAMKALRKGVDRHGRQEDSGSYCENASPGYADWHRKKKLMDEAEKTSLDDVDPASLAFNWSGQLESRGGGTMQELREQVKELTERVSLLEKRAIRGPTIAPKGPA
ncbi:MAG: hypothetical protein ACAH83_04915 [Alphaproteobacteria bacterium]